MRVQPLSRPNPLKNEERLAQDYHIVIRDIDILIPAGFYWDGASIPSLFWKIIYSPFHPDVKLPSLVHDWLYSNHQTNKETADLIFYDLLIENGVDESKADKMYWAVDNFGDCAWKHSEKNIKDMKKLYCSIKYRGNLLLYHMPSFCYKDIKE